MSVSSYRTILRSSAIVGGAQVVNILASLVKMKAAAVLLGPAGVGIAGLYMNLVQTAGTIAALGTGNVGTRQIAKAQGSGGDAGLARTRRALFWLTLLLSGIGALVFWLSSAWIARVVLSDGASAGEIAWLSLGVALSVAAGSQSSLLTGLRRIGDLARINVWSGIAGTVLGVLALRLWGAEGIVPMVLVAPCITFALGHIYVARLGPSTGAPAGFVDMTDEWRDMVKLGLAFMVSGLVTMCGHLAVRLLVQRDLGPAALGQFQAAWSIGMTYLGFVLGAMGTDYYPRLAAAMDDAETARRLVNEQTEVALLLCAPVLLAMLGLAPWVIRLLYSGDFTPAVEILRWQLLGDVLKVMSWPLGFVLLARGMGKTFIVTETIGIGVFVAGVALGLPYLGVTATGVAFLAMYAVYLPVVWFVGGRRIEFAWTRPVWVRAGIVAVAAVVVQIAAARSDTIGAVVGLGLAGATGVWSLVSLSSMTDMGGPANRWTKLVRGLRNA